MVLKPKPAAPAVRSSKVNRTWLHDHVSDPFVQRAQKDGYRARAAYKLAEIDAALHLFKPGMTVVDLGSAPGAWCQYLQRHLGRDPSCRIVALDLLPMEPVAGVTFIQGDIRDDEVTQQLHTALGGVRVDVVLSDMAPNLSGIADADAARVAGLVELVLEFAQDHLKPDGVCVAKVFHGGSYDALAAQFKAQFQVMKRIKPKASRDRSSETFLVGLRPRNPNPQPA